MKVRSLVLTILTVLLVVLAGCGWSPMPSAIPDPHTVDSTASIDPNTDTGTSNDSVEAGGGDVFDECDGAHPCGDGLVCETDADGSGARCLGDAGASCTDDFGCAASRGYACIPAEPHGREQVCGARSGPAGPCMEDDDCASGQCGEASEQCAASLGSTCYSNEDCYEPGVCRYTADGVRECQLAGDMGDYCDAASDCADGRTCTAGICTGHAGETGCVDELECPDTTVCRDPGDGVSACLEPAEESGSACVDAFDCGSGLICVDSICLAEGGAECVDSDDCTEGNVCYSGYCTGPVAEGESCQNASGLPADSICADGLMCSGATLTCTTPYSGEVGEACAVDEECGSDNGNLLLCNVWTSTCAIPGPTISAFAVSEVQTVTADGDSWADWSCVDFPEVEVPDGYAMWTYVDTLSHSSYGEDSADFLIVVDDVARMVCATAKGEKDGFWPFTSDGPPVQASYRINTLVYNPTLMDVVYPEEDESAFRAEDCPDLPRSLPTGISATAPCQTGSEYYYPVTIPSGWEAVGLVETRGYVSGGDYGGFIHTVVSLSEMAISEDYIGIALDRTMLFAGSYDSMCGGYVSVLFNTVRWRTGLPVQARLGRYNVRQPGGAVTQNLSALGDPGGVHLSFLGIQSYNLDTDRIPDDEFWSFCGSFSTSGITCDVQPSDEDSEAFPYENEIEEMLSEAAEDGTVDVCESFGAPGDLCDVVGAGVGMIVELIFDALFPDECGDGQDTDADWTLTKTQIGDGWSYSYDASTGEDSENDNVGITAEILDMNFMD